jgi:hypothetical protein
MQPMLASLKTTAKTLKRELGGAFHVVAQPDHPMLLSGPDILIGGEGKLTAVVWVGKHESTNSLVARITAARLALPPETRLLATLGDDTTVPDTVMRNFDEVAHQGADCQTIIRYATSDVSLRGDRKALKENKRRHSEKFAFALLLATLRRKHELNTIDPEVVMRDLVRGPQEPQIYSQGSLRLRRPTAQVLGSVVTSLSSRGRPVQQLRSVCDAGFTSSYLLDTGIPYEMPDANLNVLLVEEWPSVRYDPEKPLRSAAFGCWIMVKSSGAEDINQLIERSREARYVRRWRSA